MNTAVVDFLYTGKAAANYSVSHVLGCQGRGVGKKGELLVVLPRHRDGGIYQYATPLAHPNSSSKQYKGKFVRHGKIEIRERDPITLTPHGRERTWTILGELEAWTLLTIRSRSNSF